MAYIKTHFFSKTLCFGTDLNVFIPSPNADELLMGKPDDYFKPGIKYQTLYLLHGGFGDYSDWHNLTSIMRYAQDYKVALIMPSVANSFYQDMYFGSDYQSYIADELIEFAQAIFPLSSKREDNFIAGLSMGGYGAFRIALRRNDLFSYAASLSGAIDISTAITSSQDNHDIPISLINLFGKNEIAEDADIFKIIEKIKKENKDLPKFYQAVGREDFIYASNLQARDKLNALAVDLTYEEYPGIHNWEFWDLHIQDILRWLPLKREVVEG